MYIISSSIQINYIKIMLYYRAVCFCKDYKQTFICDQIAYNIFNS